MEEFFTRFTLSDRTGYRFLRHFVFWFLSWLFMGLIYGFTHTSEDQLKVIIHSYIEALIFLPQHMLLSYGIIYFILPRYVFRGKYWIGLAAVVGLILLTAFMSHIISNYVIIPLRDSLNIPVKPSTIMFFSLMAGLRGSMTIGGFAVAIKLVKLWYLKKVDNDRLEKASLVSELELLKGQLHPHFMFNTLNSIYSLALTRSEQTPDAIIRLSQLMRYMLTECSSGLVALTNEVDLLYNYISLEKIRFAERVDITTDVQGELSDKKIPPLLLMPFVENSFKHGANERMEQAWISMALHVAGSQLDFKIMNGKPENNGSQVLSSRVGLMNVQRRLHLLYPGSHELRITEDDDTYIISLTIDLDRVKIPELP